MAITRIEMTGPRANLFAAITPKNNVTLGIKNMNNKTIGTMIFHEKLEKEGANVKLPVDFMECIKRNGLNENLDTMFSYLNKLLIK